MTKLQTRFCGVAFLNFSDGKANLSNNIINYKVKKMRGFSCSVAVTWRIFNSHWQILLVNKISCSCSSIMLMQFNEKIVTINAFLLSS